MFKTLDMSARVSGKEFEKQSQELRHQLLQAQFALRERKQSLIIVVAGVHGAGKGALAHRLNEWMDPRGITTNTFWDSSDEEESRAYYWRFWRKLPPRGKVALFLGSWYNGPSQAALDKKINKKTLADSCKRIRHFEQMLAADGAVIVKLWLHVSKDTREARLTGETSHKQAIPRVSDRPYEIMGDYKKSLKVAEQVITDTDRSSSPWHIVAAEDQNYRDLAAAQIILQTLEANIPADTSTTTVSDTTDVGKVTPAPDRDDDPLSRVDLGLSIEREDYKKQLLKYQGKLDDLAWRAYREQRSVVAVYEGWDAAGKGSAIRRVTQALDPRLFQVVQIAAPSGEELAQHYLWRFWRKLERDGRISIFDRSWYGRVLVERVEGYANQAEWQRAYSEINDFEAQLADHGNIVVKFWLQLSQQEQLARFQARELEPRKQYKITEDDWRNRKKWPLYEPAVNEMIARTSTSTAPWTLVSAEDKRYARIQILKTLCKALERSLRD